MRNNANLLTDRQTDKFFDTIYGAAWIFFISKICYLPTRFACRGIILKHHWLLVILRQLSVIWHCRDSFSLPGTVPGTRASIYSFQCLILCNKFPWKKSWPFLWEAKTQVQQTPPCATFQIFCISKNYCFEFSPLKHGAVNK